MFNELDNLFPSDQNIFEEDEQTFKRQFINDNLDNPHDLFPNNSLIDLIPLFNLSPSDLSKNDISSPSPCERSHLTSTFLYSRAYSKVFEDLEQNCTLYKTHKIILKAVVEIENEELALSRLKPELKLVNITNNIVEKITFKSLNKIVNENSVVMIFNSINLEKIRCLHSRSRRPSHVFQINIALTNSKNKEINETIESAIFQIFARKPTETIKEASLSNFELQELIDCNFFQ